MNEMNATITLVTQMFRDQLDLSVERLRQMGRSDLADKMQRRWFGMFYNDPRHTLKKGEAYLVGLNPGGDDSYDYSNGEPATIEWWERNQRPNGMPYSSYLDEDWIRGKGNSPHQINVRKVLHHLLQGESEEIDTRFTFAANLCFYRTPDAQALAQYPPEIIDCFWYHRLCLGIVMPEYIVCNGNSDQASAFSEMRRQLDPAAEIQVEAVNERRYIKSFRTTIYATTGKHRVLVLGIPHLSQPYASMDDIFKAIDRILGRSTEGA